jgi:hypothetical protein
MLRQDDVVARFPMAMVRRSPYSRPSFDLLAVSARIYRVSKRTLAALSDPIRQDYPIRSNACATAGFFPTTAEVVDARGGKNPASLSLAAKRHPGIRQTVSK